MFLSMPGNQVVTAGSFYYDVATMSCESKLKQVVSKLGPNYSIFAFVKDFVKIRQFLPQEKKMKEVWGPLTYAATYS